MAARGSTVRRVDRRRGRGRGRASGDRIRQASTRTADPVRWGRGRGGPTTGPRRDARQVDGRRGCARADRARRMTRTVVSSATREVVIGDDQPFVIIGERINPTGRKVLMEE